MALGLAPDRVITVWPDYVQIGGTTFGAVYLADVLERLTQALPKTATPRIPKPAATPVSGPPPTGSRAGRSSAA
jgi:indolepyruvate decarboxylase